MLSFEKRRELVSLKVNVDGIIITISEYREFDKKKNADTDKTLFHVTASYEGDFSYNNIELEVATEEEARLLAEDMLEFFKKVRPVVKTKNTVGDV